MARYRTEIPVPAPPEPLFDYLADFSSTEEWDPGVVEAQRLDEGPLRVGSAFRVVVQVGPRRLPLRYEVLELERPHRVVLEARTATLRSYDVITVEAAAEGSVVAYDADLSLLGPWRAFGPVLALGFRRVGDRATAGLRAALARVAADGG